MRSTGHLIPVLAASAAALAAGCGGSPRPSVDTSPVAADQAPAGRIVFRRYFDDAHTHGALFVIDADGTGERQLTRPPAQTVDDNPDWSPDGRQIAFERCGPQGCRVWTVRGDGTHARRVDVRCRSALNCEVNGPSWTPNGSNLVVGIYQGRVRERGGFNSIQRSSIELYDLRHREQRTILERTNWAGDATQPALSPDGRTIVYKRANSWLTKPAEAQALYAVDFDGTHNRRLTPWNLEAGDHPVWSPDSSTILFRSFEEDEGRQSDLWTVKPDGSGLAQLTHFKPGTIVRSTSYSPGGQWIVQAGNGVDGNADLYLMRADGSDNHPITRTKLWDSAPDWGPPAP
jgi:Tol biopolymer transport system component